MPDDDINDMHETLPQRTLRTTFLVAALFATVYALRGQGAISLGLGVGAALGLFSLWTLTAAIPRLFGGGSPVGRFWLGLLTMAKLPIYMIVLDFAMTSKLVSPFAVFCGVALVPVVLVLKVVTSQYILPAGRRAAVEG